MATFSGQIQVNSGKGKQSISKEFHQPVLINLRRVDGLPAGFSDLEFIAPSKVAFIECKNDIGHLRPEQKNFLERMRSMGYHAGVAKDMTVSGCPICKRAIAVIDRRKA